MNVFHPRLFYSLAILVCALLLWQNPVTLFLAACFSCLTLPIYRRLQIQGRTCILRQRERTVAPRIRRARPALARSYPLLGYLAACLATILVPVAMLVLLVSPQAVAGLARLRELQANNFQLPPQWVAFIQSWQAKLADYPQLEKIIDDFMNNVNELLGDAVSALVSRSFVFVSGTMSVIWTTFLFFTLTILFSIYFKQIRAIAGRVFRLPQSRLRRFTRAIYRALRSIMLGIIFVALIQGLLCGIGFAVAGLNQPAFWGMLAAFVAPIPFVGTALVWGPLCLTLWFTGRTVAALGLALWGMLAVAGVDNVLRPLFLRQGIKAPFFVLILAILCGLSSFGAVGLIAGPVLLAFALQAIEEANSFYACE